MLHSRHILVTILAASLALHGCKKDSESTDNQGEAEAVTTRAPPGGEPVDEPEDQVEENAQVGERAVATVEEAAPAEPQEPAGPIIEPVLVQGHPYERTVEFRSKRETRVERGNQTIFGTTYLDWSITYRLTARDRTSKRDYLVDVRILDVSATRDSEPWTDSKLPEEGADFRCRLRQRGLSCEGMPRAVEGFAQHWLFGTWGDFVPPSVVSPGERWQRRGPYGARFGIDGDEPTTLAFEVTSIDELGRNQFRIHNDLQIESDVFWPTPGGQRRADISGSGEAEFDSILGLFSGIELGWDGMLVHEGRVGPTPFRFTRREETRIRIDTSSPSGRPGAVRPRPRSVANVPAPAPEEQEGEDLDGSPNSMVDPPSEGRNQAEEDTVGNRPY